MRATSMIRAVRLSGFFPLSIRRKSVAVVYREFGFTTRGPERVDRGRLLREPLQEGDDPLRDRPVRGELGRERRELLPVRELPVPQEVRSLLERGVVREVPDVIPVVQEPALLPVDEADPALHHVNVVKALVDLRGPGPADVGAHAFLLPARDPEVPDTEELRADGALYVFVRT